MKVEELKIKDPKVKDKLFKIFEEMGKCDRCYRNKKLMMMINGI